MICEKCTYQNDAISVNCINCGNSLNQKTIKNIEAEINHNIVKGIIFWGSVILSVWIFQSYKHLFFDTYFDRINWYQVVGATIFGAICGFVGKKIGDFLFRK